MDKENTFSRIRSAGLIAVIRGPSPDLTFRMVQSLVAGEVTVIEVTYSTPQAEEVLSQLSRTYRDQVLLGMGTLTDPKQVRSAVEAGAQFLVSPHCDPLLGQEMVRSGRVAMIGALTPTEVFHAHRLGADAVKIFPGSFVGPAYIKALRGPFPEISFVPTGGVSLENVADWFSAGVAAIGAGSELCPREWVEAGRFEEIQQRAMQFVEVVRRAKGGDERRK